MTPADNVGARVGSI